MFSPRMLFASHLDIKKSPLYCESFFTSFRFLLQSGRALCFLENVFILLALEDGAGDSVQRREFMLMAQCFLISGSQVILLITEVSFFCSVQKN